MGRFHLRIKDLMRCILILQLTDLKMHEEAQISFSNSSLDEDLKYIMNRTQLNLQAPKLLLTIQKFLLRWLFAQIPVDCPGESGKRQNQLI